MTYSIERNKIIIEDLKEFDITQILECGQVFSYKKIAEKKFEVYSSDKRAVVEQLCDRAIITTADPAYFENYFDLKRDYAEIKGKLQNNKELASPILFGGGIRILKQDKLETIISFVVSANNNISRITKSLFYIREKLGSKVGDYFAFPTLNQLMLADEKFFVQAGLGYRAKQMVKLIQQLKHVDLDEWDRLDTQTLKNRLIALSGIGPKVADCILLFGFSRGDVFPVDTWISKVFYDFYGEVTKNRVKMSEILTKKYGDLSGVAQQYLFYYKRSI